MDGRRPDVQYEALALNRNWAGLSKCYENVRSFLINKSYSSIFIMLIERDLHAFLNWARHSLASVPLDSAMQFVEGGECRFGQRQDADGQTGRESDGLSVRSEAERVE